MFFSLGCASSLLDESQDFSIFDGRCFGSRSPASSSQPQPQDRSLTLERDGAPQYTGDPQYGEEMEERTLTGFRSSTTKESKAAHAANWKMDCVAALGLTHKTQEELMALTKTDLKMSSSTLRERMPLQRTQAAEAANQSHLELFSVVV